MNDYIEESQEVMEETSFGESYDKELATYQSGWDEGMEEKNLEIAKNMKYDGLKPEDISKYTKLSIEEIEKL